MNPYKVLNISPEADKREVVLAAAIALRQRNFSGKEIALAQKQLLDPATQPILDFLYNFTFTSLIAASRPSIDQQQISPDICRLSIFDENHVK